MKLSYRLQSCRKEKDLTLQDVAALINVDVKTYEQYESGCCSPDHEQLCKLAEFFGFSLQKSYPLIRSLQYPPDMLDALKSTRDRIAEKLLHLERTQTELSVKDLYSTTHAMIEEMGAAIKPAFDILTDTQTLTNIDSENIDSPQTEIIMKYRLEDMDLILQCNQLQSEVVRFMFSRIQ